MKIVKKIKLPIIFILYLMICWHFGSAYILRDISFLPNDNNSIFIIVVYFGLIIFIYFLLRFVRMIIATTAAARIIPITTRIIPIIPLASSIPRI